MFVVWYHTVNYLHRDQMYLKKADFGNLLWLLLCAYLVAFDAEYFLGMQVRSSDVHIL